MAWEAAQQQNATLMQMNAQALGAGSGPCKLYVGNLHPNISVRLLHCSSICQAWCTAYTPPSVVFLKRRVCGTAIASKQHSNPHMQRCAWVMFADVFRSHSWLV